MSIAASYRVLTPWLVSVAAALPFALASASAATGPRSQQAVFNEAAKSIENEIAAGRLTGLSVALVAHGRIVWERGFGWADRDAGRRASARTPFSIASSTKPITTTAMMMLVADGKLDIDAPANIYLGADKIVDANGPADGATLRRMASHSSGLPTFFIMYPENGAATPPPVAELIRDNGRLVAPAGERYEYSNLGMAIVAEIVARRSGEDFGHYLQTRVFAPLGMHDSFLGSDPELRHDGALRYDDDGQPLPFYLTATPGSGEVFASAHDMARFAMLHLKDDLGARAKILSGAQLDALHAPTTAVGPGLAYGLGWQIYERAGKSTVLFHGGGQSGVAAEFVLVPDADVACVVLSNRRGSRAFFEGLRDRLLRTQVADWSGIPPQPAPKVQPLAANDAALGRWQGMLLAQGRRIPVTLDVASPSQGTLALGGDAPHAIADLGWADGLLSGDTEGDIASADARRDGLRRLSLNLKLRGDRIDGEIIAWDKTSMHMTVLPSWVELRKVPPVPGRADAV